MDLYYLIYTSVPARPMKDAELQELLSVAREANSRFEVTGMLICMPESFIQLIEGSHAHIEQLYKNIQKDRRHFRVITLREGPIIQRFFPDWAMAVKRQATHGTNEDILGLQDEKVFQLFDILEN
jgi:hypothetical protein